MSWYEDETVTVLHGDCIEVMRCLPDDSVDSIVTDPPYGLGFMGRAWDSLPPGLPWARECLRVLKPGGHLLAFGGTRTWHRLAVAVEDAGFEVRDSIAWLYGSGFPKSLDVSKAIDKRGGADIGWFGPWLREERRRRGISSNQLAKHFPSRTGGETGCVRNWELGFNLPTPEQFNTLCRVLDLPFGEIAEAEREVIGTRDGNRLAVAPGQGADRSALSLDVTAPATPAAQQWAGFGTALKPAFEPVVVARKPLVGTVAGNVLAFGTGALNIDGCRVGSEARPVMVRTATMVAASSMAGASTGATSSGETTTAGRWPANVVLDGTQADALDEQADASRFFPTFRYQAKAPTSERPKVDGVAHATVKPLALMRWLVRLVTPPGGLILEPFAGSGTTVEAAMLEGFRVTAIEREADYLPLILARINRVGVTPPPPEPEPDLLDLIEGDVA